ncbi:MAG: CorA family divalent cation transporter [Bacteriovoracaceae bacterium]
MIKEQLSKQNYTWIDVVEPKTEDFNQMGELYGLPYLLIQDTLRPEHLPKFEDTEEGRFFMMRSFDKENISEDVTVQTLTRKIALFVTNNHLISIHRVHLEHIDALAEKIKKSEQPKTLQGLVHQIALSTLRTYEKPIMDLQDLYDEFEHDILVKKSENIGNTRIYNFRRKVSLLKRILRQTSDAFLRSRDFWEDYSSMLQDIKENIDQLYFQLDELTDNFEHLFELYVALNDQRANEVMKVLTVFSTILLPLNFIASFYGMNFTHLPGLDSPSAFFILVIMMLFLSISGIWYFKSKGWFTTPRE